MSISPDSGYGAGARWDLWGPLADRYRHDAPRRILALDGGGIRSVITLSVLQRLEDELRTARGADPEFRLCDFFDLIGGTSTGAVIAAGLARGMSVREVSGFFGSIASVAFPSWKFVHRWQSLYGQGGVARMLMETFGEDTDLRPEHLRCLLVVVTRNATTDSAWPVSSNPFAKYNDPARPDCNLRIPLWKLVRASAAAPIYLPPEVVTWGPNDPDKAFVFVDGGTTAYNNPAFLLFRMATEPAHRLGWPTGERRLLLVSVGAGYAPVLSDIAPDPANGLIESATRTVSALMRQVSVDQDVNCRVIGRCTFGGIIDRELHDLVPHDPGPPGRLGEADADGGKAFLYARYNAELTADGLLQLGLRSLDARSLRGTDAVENIDDLADVGAALADRVRLDHLGPFVTA